MVTMLEQARQLSAHDIAVNAILEREKVGYSARLTGAGIDRNSWTCDAWEVCFMVGARRVLFSYHTGTGHRVISKQEKARIVRYYGNHKTAWVSRTIEEYAKPYAPKPASVLACLLLDARALDLSFKVWCDEYGYSDDSLSALDTYRACCDIAQKLYSAFSRQVIAEFSGILADY